jgi:diguanylate cyclase (GGDEF)-like protein
MCHLFAVWGAAMIFDLRTIYAMTALACLVLGLIQAVVFMSGRFDRWLACWSASNIFLGIGNFCIGLRGSAADIITIQIGNFLVIAGCVLMPAAMRMFAGRPVDFARCALLVLVLYLPMLLAFPGADAARERVIYGSLIAGLLDLAVAYEASRLVSGERLYTARLTAWLFLTTASLYVLRAGLGALGVFGNQGLFETGSGNHAVLGLLAMVFLTLRGVLIVLMAAERAANRLRETANHDPLTGVLNRSGLLNALQHGPQGRTALLLVDLDHFKQLNDTGGHALGDRILCEFAAIAKAIAGKTGLVARHGGDEFVLLLHDRTIGEAVSAAEQLRTVFAQSTAEIAAGLQVRPTLSIGIAVVAEEGETFEAMLHRADHALYRVKRRGRDGIDVCDGQPERTGVGTNSAERIKNISKSEAVSAALTPISSPPQPVVLS